jgi:hypothetical protein
MVQCTTNLILFSLPAVGTARVAVFHLYCVMTDAIFGRCICWKDFYGSLDHPDLRVGKIRFVRLKGSLQTKCLRHSRTLKLSCKHKKGRKLPPWPGFEITTRTQTAEKFPYSNRSAGYSLLSIYCKTSLKTIFIPFVRLWELASGLGQNKFEGF